MAELKHWRDVSSEYNVDCFYCDCCKEYQYTYHSPNRKCLVNDGKVIKNFCYQCAESYDQNSCSYCQGKHEDYILMIAVPSKVGCKQECQNYEIIKNGMKLCGGCEFKTLCKSCNEKHLNSCANCQCESHRKDLGNRIILYMCYNCIIKYNQKACQECKKLEETGYTLCCSLCVE